MAIDGAPWWARTFNILLAQFGLLVAQYLNHLQGGGWAVTLGIAFLQAVMGSVGAYGLKGWAASNKTLKTAGDILKEVEARRNGPVQ